MVGPHADLTCTGWKCAGLCCLPRDRCHSAMPILLYFIYFPDLYYCAVLPSSFPGQDSSTSTDLDRPVEYEYTTTSELRTQEIQCNFHRIFMKPFMSSIICIGCHRDLGLANTVYMLGSWKWLSVQFCWLLFPELYIRSSTYCSATMVSAKVVVIRGLLFFLCSLLSIARKQ